MLLFSKHQIAYYFSDANLRHDRFMRTLAGVDEESTIQNNNNKHEQKSRTKKDEKDQTSKEVTWADGNNQNDCQQNVPSKGVTQIGPPQPETRSADHLSGCRPVPCSAFLAFNKIASLVGKNAPGSGKEDEDIYRAFLYEQEWTAFGTALLFDAKNRTISRREPFYLGGESEVTDRVLYVEGFNVAEEQTSGEENEDTGNKNDEDIFEQLKATFEEHGTVLSIRTPRFRASRQLMGFAFIEFAEKEAVEKAVKYFKKVKKEEEKVKKVGVVKPLTVDSASVDATLATGGEIFEVDGTSSSKALSPSSTEKVCTKQGEKVSKKLKMWLYN